MRTGTPRWGPVLAALAAVGLFPLVGCLQDIDKPEPEVDHFHHDWDGDGYCEEEPCEPGAEPGDCNDDNDQIYPGAPEACDGEDNDCDGAPDEDEQDADGDGYLGCAECDDTNADVYPGAPELCDGKDNDCDGSLSAEEIDDDGDGYTECDGDCEDTDTGIFPGATEACDGVDNDCDGAPDAEESDADGDGVMRCEGDCDDGDVDVYPGAPELCDGIDNDCDGHVGADEKDQDADGQMVCEGDCDDSDPTIYDSAPELCDGIDNDCDTVIPDDETDDDKDGYVECDPWIGTVKGVVDGDDCDDTNAATYPGAPEVCDQEDNDCGGDIGLEEYDHDGDGFTECDAKHPWVGTVPGILGNMDCNDGDDTVCPSLKVCPEICDRKDNNCDGFVPLDEVDNDIDGETECEGDCLDVGKNAAWYNDLDVDKDTYSTCGADGIAGTQTKALLYQLAG